MSGSLEKDKATRAKKELGECFEVKVIPEVDYMLGIRVETVVERIQIFQKAYIERMLEKFSIMSYKPRSTPLPVRIFLSINNSLTSGEKIAEMKISY